MEHDVYHYCGFFVQNSFGEPICSQGSRVPKFPLPNFRTGFEENLMGHTVRYVRQVCFAS